MQVDPDLTAEAFAIDKHGAGVSMWNSVIVFEGCELSHTTLEALVKVRHIAVDCMYMSTTVLGGISARYNIDDLSLLKFYTACGQRYANDLSDMEMADVCFTKAAEFVESALNESRKEDGDKNVFATAMFDLLIGRAECAWERGESDQAEMFVSDARSYMTELPGEYEFLASVEYNFGLFAYQAKETERALKWLKRSMQTRETDLNTSRDPKKQATTARLAGVCLLALQEYDESWKMMNLAEEMAHDPVGSYLLLKLTVIARKPHAVELLQKIVEDTCISLEVCMASVALFSDAQQISDAATGFEQVFARFKHNLDAVIAVIGPRYFETLVALGKMEKALDVLEVCCLAMEKMTERPASGEVGTDIDPSVQFSQWSALLLTTGSKQADQKDFTSAAKLLNRCLQFARSSTARLQPRNAVGSKERISPPSKNVVLENEARVCRLASACALRSVDDMKKGTQVKKDVDSGSAEAEVDLRKTELLKMAVVHAERAKHLEPTDFAPRLLLFRAHLLSKEFNKAALELRQSSSEIRSFDPGALAEAACAARDIGSRSSVIAALRCILNLDPSALCNSLASSTASSPNGFFGKVLLSCVHIILDGEQHLSEDEAAEGNAGGKGTQNASTEIADLVSVLERGLVGLEHLGVEEAFGHRKESIHAALTYLANICWNKGREFGTSMDFKLWQSFFDLCYRYSVFLPEDADNLHTRRMSKVMSASAVIEDQESKTEDFRRAREHVREARSLSLRLQELSPVTGEDPIEGLLLTLEARCCVGCQDLDALTHVVDHALQKTLAAPAIEQLASVCYSGTGQKSDGESRMRFMDLTTALLSKASDVRLCSGLDDLDALAVTMREHLGIELSRGSSPGRAFKVYQKAVGVVAEHSPDFPMDERRWLVAVGWDRAQMHRRVGQNAEARRWCEGAKELAQGCTTLSTYLPRLEAVLRQLRD